MSEPDWVPLSGMIHEALGDMCLKVEDKTDHVICVDIAIKLMEKGYRLVGNEKTGD